MGNRKAAEEFCLNLLSRLDNNGPNRDIMAKRFSKMSDADFEAFVERIEKGEETLHLYVPNKGKHDVSVERNLEIAKEIGHEFFEQVWLTDPVTGQVYLTPQKLLTLHLMIRRQQQTGDKKISVPTHNRTVDDLTGQPTGDSKGASISFPEFQVLFSKNLDKSLEELVKVRGGDEAAFREHNRLIMQTGVGSLAALEGLNGQVKSTQSLGVFLNGMHLGNTL